MGIRDHWGVLGFGSLCSGGQPSVYGRLALGRYEYWLDTDEGTGKVTVQEIDTTKQIPSLPLPMPPSAAEKVERMIDNSEAEMNRSLAQSGVKGQINIIHSFELVDYQGSAKTQPLMEAMCGPTFGFGDCKDTGQGLSKTVHKVREDVRADLLTVLTDQGTPITLNGMKGTIAGVGNLPYKEVTSTGTDNRAFSVVLANGPGAGQSFAHELGHNFGLSHDDYTLQHGNMKAPPLKCSTTTTGGKTETTCNEPVNKTRPYGRGWITKSRDKVSVMGYTATCDPGGIGAFLGFGGCTHSGEYSNPKHTSSTKGEPLGSADNDSARALNEVFPLVAKYREVKLLPARYDLKTMVSPDGGGKATPAHSGPFTKDASVAVTAEPAQGYHLDHWKLDGKDVGKQNPYTVSMDRRHRLTAVFDKGEDPEAVTELVTRVAPDVKAGQVLPSKTGPYTTKDRITLDAAPSKYRKLHTWMVDGRESGTGNSLPLAMDRDHVVTATFSCAKTAPGGYGNEWRDRGAEHGRLGCPTTGDTQWTKGRRYQRFEGGTLIWDAKHRKMEVRLT
ncbi:M12 family metallo-peptidase [Streptomyces monticola]|uniref:M12 family metallo-peptidase n=1 Tax=Streptomyces monticola TaxID=2666263 RepID=A0ABW2JSM5_9ACTN